MTDARKVAFRRIAEASLAAAAHRLARSTQIMRRRLLQRILSRLHAGRGIHSDPVAAGGRKDMVIAGRNLSAATYCRSQSTKNQDARATKYSQPAVATSTAAAQPIVNDLPRRPFKTACDRLPDLSIPTSGSSDCNTFMS
jgi:hypothetical protein